MHPMLHQKALSLLETVHIVLPMAAFCTIVNYNLYKRACSRACVCLLVRKLCFHFSLLQCVCVCGWARRCVLQRGQPHECLWWVTAWNSRGDYLHSLHKRVKASMCARVWENYVGMQNLHEYQWPCLSKRGQICTPSTCIR